MKLFESCCSKITGNIFRSAVSKPIMKKLSVYLVVAIVFSLTQITLGQDKDADKELIEVGVLNSRALSLPSPEYPAAAKAVQATGIVRVAVVVTKTGAVKSAHIVSGHPLLRSAALSAARSAKFMATLKGGKPVEVSGLLLYKFGDAEGSKSKDLYPNVIRAGIINGKAISLPRPEYPDAAKAANATGLVRVSVVIGKNGEVESVYHVSGHPLLIDISVRAAMKARFAPTTHGKPVKVRGTIVYRFK